MSRVSRRWPADTRAIEWSSREDFASLRGEWLELVRRDAELLPVAKVTLAEIGSRFSHDKSHAWPSLTRIAADIATSPKTVQRAVVDGMGRGWLIIERMGFGKSNHYSLSTSRRIVNQVEDAHGKRIALLADSRPPFRSPASVMEAGAIQDTGDLSLRTPVTFHSGHPRPVITDTGDQLISPKNPLNEPEQGTPLQGLSDATVQDRALACNQINQSDLYAALGEGDGDLGKRRAARLRSDRLSFLMSQLSDLGIVGAADQIREAAAIADAHEAVGARPAARRDDS